MLPVCACTVNGEGICRGVVPIQIVRPDSANSLSEAGLCLICFTCMLLLQVSAYHPGPAAVWL